MKYIITGGAGFIGSHLARALTEQKQTVKILDNFSTGKQKNLADIANRITFVKGDITNLAFLKTQFKTFDYVLHFAAVSAVAESFKNPRQTHNTNVTGTLNVLLATKECGIRRVVFASSASVYGDTSKGKNKETDAAFPLSPYAASKVIGEIYCKLFYTLYGVPTIILRYFNVYGQNQNQLSEYASVIPAFVSQLTKNRRPTIYGTGTQSRDFIFIDDLVLATLLAVKGPKKALGEIFNISSGKSLSIKNLYKKMQKVAGKPNTPPHFAKKREGDIYKSVADITKAQKILGFKPAITIEEGLKRYIQWYESSGTKN